MTAPTTSSATTGGATPAHPAKRRVRTPTVLQMEAVECGAAALAIVLAHHDKWVPLEELRVSCGVSRDGSRASNVLKAARRYGMVAKGYQMDTAALAELQTPFIVFWNFHHFLVVEGFKGDTVFLNDPGTGPRKVHVEEFENSFTGVALTFRPGPDFKPGGSRTKAFDGLGRRLRGGGAALLLVLLASLLLVIPGLMAPAFSRIFIDRVLTAGFTSWIGPLFAVIAVTALAAMALTSLQQHYLLRLETRMALRSSAAFVRHVLRLPVEFFSQRSPADVSSRIQANDTVAQLLSRDLATAAVSAIVVVFYAVFMFSYDLVLTLISVALVVANIVLLRWVARSRVDATRRLRQDRGRLVGTTYNGLQLIETLKATGTENDFFGRWAGFQTKVANGQQRLGVSTQVLTVVPPLLVGLNTGLILWIGSDRVVTGTITIGVLVAFQGLLASFTRPVQQLTELGQKVQDVTADLTRLADVERYRIASQFVVEPEVTTGELAGHVELQAVTFGYSPLAPPLIEGFDLVVPPGRRVALVGGSGSGKSTLAKVISGLYEPWSGEVRLDGRPRSAYSRHVLGASLAVVDQDIFLFEGTVRDNLTLWDDTIPEEVLVEALRDAMIYDDVMRRPGGLDAVITEGGRNLSGGQRQRLEIARALTAQPRIVVLDEATSALDTETERRIDDNLRRRGCTCVIIAHRLSTIRDADEIIVLDRGRVVQRGRHDELKVVEGAYLSLIGAE
ncbi:NHLP family bacteriocin export ABC transporter peptidase/permease/ATPase subunit [Desertimonas flava]|uniref:NHLP family bacteriocin export ABC transporter peptidase/permease/ATPase subunit n=1 Tax=Desertimonas flava TaxID=2064846 RepID=UPI000E347059|nr:NHLP family bacteriocin export ABC transporter peptidase/permease/ATPase subunit [Desertimonas flava]